MNPQLQSIPQGIVTGIDLVEIGRIAKSMERRMFLQRVYSPQELELMQLLAGSGKPLLASHSAVSTAAVNFCAKEAFAKALGSGIRGFALNEVSALRDSLGAPYLVFTGKARQLVEERGLAFSVSLSHTKEYACAVVTGWYCK